MPREELKRPPPPPAPTGEPESMPPLREVQRRHILDVMTRVQGNRARAARILGISERNLYRLLKRYDQPVESSSNPDRSSDL
mgnify:CR=1 FL=1